MNHAFTHVKLHSYPHYFGHVFISVAFIYRMESAMFIWTCETPVLFTLKLTTVAFHDNQHILQILVLVNFVLLIIN